MTLVQLIYNCIDKCYIHIHVLYFHEFEQMKGKGQSSIAANALPRFARCEELGKSMMNLARMNA